MMRQQSYKSEESDYYQNYRQSKNLYQLNREISQGNMRSYSKMAEKSLPPLRGSITTPDSRNEDGKNNLNLPILTNKLKNQVKFAHNSPKREHRRQMSLDKLKLSMNETRGKPPTGL